MNVKMNIQYLRQSSARMLLLSIIIFFSQCQKNFEYQPSPSRPNGKLSVDIVTFLRSRNDFTLLSQAIDKTGLAVTLSGPGPITLFAPDDIAFKAYLGTRKLDDIPVATLKDILMYHAVRQNLLSQNLTLSRENYESLLLCNWGWTEEQSSVPREL